MKHVSLLVLAPRRAELLVSDSGLGQDVQFIEGSVHLHVDDAALYLKLDLGLGYLKIFLDVIELVFDI